MNPGDIDPTLRDNIMAKWWDRKGLMPKSDSATDEAMVMFGFEQGIQFVRRRIESTLLNVKR